MAIINKKLIHFDKKANFEKAYLALTASNDSFNTYNSTSDPVSNIPSGSNGIKFQSIVFIKDTQEIWTHGLLYNNDSIKESIPNIKIFTFYKDDLENNHNEFIKVYEEVVTNGNDNVLLLFDCLNTEHHDFVATTIKYINSDSLGTHVFGDNGISVNAVTFYQIVLFNNGSYRQDIKYVGGNSIVDQSIYKDKLNAELRDVVNTVQALDTNYKVKDVDNQTLTVDENGIIKVKHDNVHRGLSSYELNTTEYIINVYNHDTVQGLNPDLKYYVYNGERDISETATNLVQEKALYKHLLEMGNIKVFDLRQEENIEKLKEYITNDGDLTNIFAIFPKNLYFNDQLLKITEYNNSITTVLSNPFINNNGLFYRRTVNIENNNISHTHVQVDGTQIANQTIEEVKFSPTLQEKINQITVFDLNNEENFDKLKEYLDENGISNVFIITPDDFVISNKLLRIISYNDQLTSDTESFLHNNDYFYKINIRFDTKTLTEIIRELNGNNILHDSINESKLDDSVKAKLNQIKVFDLDNTEDYSVIKEYINENGLDGVYYKFQYENDEYTVKANDIDGIHSNSEVFIQQDIQNNAYNRTVRVLLTWSTSTYMFQYININGEAITVNTISELKLAPEVRTKLNQFKIFEVTNTSDNTELFNYIEEDRTNLSRTLIKYINDDNEGRIFNTLIPLIDIINNQQIIVSDIFYNHTNNCLVLLYISVDECELNISYINGERIANLNSNSYNDKSITYAKLNEDVISKLSNVLGEEVVDEDTIPEFNTLTREQLKKDLFIDLWNTVCRSYGGYNEETGYFELNGLTDITYEEAVRIYSTYNGSLRSDYSHLAPQPIISSPYFNIRTLLPICSWIVNISCEALCSYNNTIEVLCFHSDRGYDAVNLTSYNIFMLCTKLKRIIGNPIVIRYNGSFDGCKSLTYVKIRGLNIDLSITDCPLLELECFEYMVDLARVNLSTPKPLITITVHPDVYTKLTDELNTEWHQVLLDAVEKNIQFATIT